MLMWSLDYKAELPWVICPYIAVMPVVTGLSVACADHVPVLGLTHTLTLIDGYYSNYHRTPASQKHCNKFSTLSILTRYQRGERCGAVKTILDIYNICSVLIKLFAE